MPALTVSNTDMLAAAAGVCGGRAVVSGAVQMARALGTQVVAGQPLSVRTRQAINGKAVQERVALIGGQKALVLRLTEAARSTGLSFDPKEPQNTNDIILLCGNYNRVMSIIESDKCDPL